MRICLIAVLLIVSNIINAALTDDFVITVKTDNPGAGTNQEFTIYRNYGGLTYNYNVDCDNNGIDEATTQLGNYTCTYPTSGIYTIRIKDNTGVGDGFPSFKLNDASGNSVAEKILSIEQWGTGTWISMQYAFSGASNLAINAIDQPDFSNVINMYGMFIGASLVNPNTSNWDTSSVTSMGLMFLGATSANPDTSQWNTSSVTDMRSMFNSATSANPDTSQWDISNVTTMASMFFGVALPMTSYEDMLIGFAAQNVQSNITFHGGNSRYCSAAAQAAREVLINTYNWTITDGGVCDPADDFVIRIKSDNTGGSPTEFVIYTNPTGVNYNYNVDCDNDGVFEAFAQTSDYTCNYGSTGAGIYTIRIQDNSGVGTGYSSPWFGSTDVRSKVLSLEQWGTMRWTSMESAFKGCTSLVINASEIPDFSNVTSMEFMFQATFSANPDTSNWDTSSVTTMRRMFWSALSANPNTSNWDMSSVTNMRSMFSGADSANPDTSNWDTSSVTNMSFMFSGADSANPDTNNWDTSSVTSMSSMFSSATSANPNVSNWDTSSVTSLSFMFRNATSASPVISNWDVSSVTNMTSMFDGISLPTSEYEAALINFSTQNLKSNVEFGAGNSRYCSSAAQAARASMISFNGWNITDGGVCPAEIFQDGFESAVVVFKTADAQFDFDFSDVALLLEDDTPKLIAAGLDVDKQINVKIYLRQFDGVLQIMQSQLFEDFDGEQVWGDGLWYEVFEQGLSEVVLW
jgi:surface protein